MIVIIAAAAYMTGKRDDGRRTRKGIRRPWWERVPENARRSRILADPSRAFALRADERGLPMVMKRFAGERRCAAAARRSAPGDR
jgi:hypothetical protein